MLGFDALARYPLGGAPVVFIPPPAQSTPVNANWLSVTGTGYCASVTLQLITTDSGSAAGVTLQLDGFDIIYEEGGLL